MLLSKCSAGWPSTLNFVPPLSSWGITLFFYHLDTVVFHWVFPYHLTSTAGVTHPFLSCSCVWSFRNRYLDLWLHGALQEAASPGQRRRLLSKAILPLLSGLLQNPWEVQFPNPGSFWLIPKYRQGKREKSYLNVTTLFKARKSAVDANSSHIWNCCFEGEAGGGGEMVGHPPLLLNGFNGGIFYETF